MTMTDYTGKFKQISSNNFDQLLKHFGMPDNMIDHIKARSQNTEITKTGNVYTILVGGKTEYEFELGKQFDAPSVGGKSVKSVIVADGNRLIQTTGDVTEVREFTDSELRVTISSGPVVAVLVYTRQ